MKRVCLRHAVDPGIAFYLRAVFDFDEGEDTRRAVESVMKVRFSLLIRSPPMYTVLGSPDVFRTKERAQQGVCEEAPIGSWASSKACTFMLPFAQVTDQTGRFFLHEHPWTARSWFMLEVSQLSNIRHVRLVQGRICQFAMRSECNGSVGPVLKPTGFLTDSFCVAHQKHHQKHHGERQVCS